MFKKMLREFFLLSPGERRGLVMVSAIMILSLAVRLIIGVFPQRMPEGVEDFSLAISQLNDSRFYRAVSDTLPPGDSLPGGRSNGEYKSKIHRPIQGDKRKSRFQIVNLNEIDSAGLLPLPGIGPVFAGRIIKYRDLLGGFVKKEQLLEVYGMDSSRYLPLVNKLHADSTRIRKINPNTAEFREMLRHPYLEYGDVLALVKYCDLEGPFDSLQTIWNQMLLPDSTLERIGPYLGIE